MRKEVLAVGCALMVFCGCGKNNAAQHYESGWAAMEKKDYTTAAVSYTNLKNEPGYFFQNVKEIFTAEDLTVANMEGTLTTSDARQEKTFAFKGDPSYTEILTRGGVEATNLANNHSHDYGDQSYEDTIQYLEAAGITTFGYDRTAVMDVKGIKRCV